MKVSSFPVINVIIRQPHKCQCDYTATTKGHILNHENSIYEGVKFSCDQCDYTATAKGHLLNYNKSIHEGVKFPCDHCYYKATLKGDFKLFHSLVLSMFSGHV